MAKKYSTIKQHEPLRAPSNWGSQEKKFIAQLEEIFDDLYRRFGRLTISDMGIALRQAITDGADNISSLLQTAEKIEAQVKGVSETASKANAAAEKAQSAADEANAAASAAANTASAANSAAMNAAGLASEKGKVWFQTTPPAGNASDLWINITDGANTPMRWNGSAWVAVTDKAATDAADAAASANTAAADAASKADAADAAAKAAKETADAAKGLAESVSSTLTQTSKAITAEFNRVGLTGLGGSVTGITQIDETGLTVNHSNINTRTKMNADGFKILNSADSTIGGLVVIDGQVYLASQALMNPSVPAFRIGVVQKDFEGEQMGLHWIFNNAEQGAISAHSGGMRHDVAGNLSFYPSGEFQVNADKGFYIYGPNNAGLEVDDEGYMTLYFSYYEDDGTVDRKRLSMELLYDAVNVIFSD